MAEHDKKEAKEAIQEEMAAGPTGKGRDWAQLYKKEDWWANWLGLALLLFALVVMWSAVPREAPQELEEYQAIVEQEEERAPFATIEDKGPGRAGQSACPGPRSWPCHGQAYSAAQGLGRQPC